MDTLVTKKTIAQRVPFPIWLSIFSAAIYTYLFIAPTAPLAFLSPALPLLFGKDWNEKGFLVSGAYINIFGCILFLPFVIGILFWRRKRGKSLPTDILWYVIGFMIFSFIFEYIFLFIAVSSFSPL